MKLIDVASLLFSVDFADTTVTPSFGSLTEFVENQLTVPLLLALGQRYSVTLSLTNDDPVEFMLTSASELP